MTNTSLKNYDQSLEDYTQQLVAEGALLAEDRKRLLTNRDFFAANRESFERLTWVGVVDGVVYTAPTKPDLEAELATKKHGASAYIEKIL